MADPVTMAIISTGFQVVGAIQQGRAQEAQYEAQARAADYNRRVAEQNAALVEQQTQTQLEQQDRERRIRLGQARASAGASGISGGSIFDILQSSAAQEELDLLTIESEGLLRQRDFTSQAGMFGAGAANARTQGQQSMAAGVMGGLSAGIQGGSNLPSRKKETIYWNQGGTSSF